ncbi:hypothetical protein Q9R46_27780, partial [Paenibacillus sp. RRE4]|uniref:hypothetical protein n=1 Tax=Paenibacillus sp. RRE4 TaxID=2962587 RepID=UPI0028821664
ISSTNGGPGKLIHKSMVISLPNPRNTKNTMAVPFSLRTLVAKQRSIATTVFPTLLGGMKHDMYIFLLHRAKLWFCLQYRCLIVFSYKLNRLYIFYQ